jgi:hypothetical protein
MKEAPLAEVTLRRYEKPLPGHHRDLIKKVCLSLGLLQPGDSRDSMVDIVLVLEKARKERRWLSSFQIRDDVEQTRKEHGYEIKGLAESNIRRQLKRLRDILLVDKQENQYRLAEFAPLHELFESKIERFLIPQCLERIKDYLRALDKS